MSCCGWYKTGKNAVRKRSRLWIVRERHCAQCAVSRVRAEESQRRHQLSLRRQVNGARNRLSSNWGSRKRRLVRLLLLLPLLFIGRRNDRMVLVQVCVVELS